MTCLLDWNRYFGKAYVMIFPQHRKIRIPSEAPNTAASRRIPRLFEYVGQRRQKAGLALLLLVLCLAPAKIHAYDCTVTSMADSGAGTLRQCITDTTSGGTIGFSTGGAITLTSGSLAFGSKTLTIQGLTSGSGPSLRNTVTINGNASFAIFAITDASGDLTLANLNLTNGRDTDGAISINMGHLTVRNCTFSGNVSTGASTGGAAIYNYKGSASIENSTFLANSAAKDGGAINNDEGALTVTNSTFSGNTAGTNGGSIYSNSGYLTVTNSTFVGNVAATSGAIHESSTTVSESNNIFYSNSSGNADFSLSTSDIVGVDPKLAPLGWYGGPTQTMIPLPGSPAICSVTGNLTTDQRGFSVNPTCGAGLVDAGAVQTNQYTVTSLSDISYGSCTVSGCSLRDAISAANSSLGGDIIFASGLSGKITLSSALPSIAGAANVLGPGSSKLTISGNNSPTVGSLFIVSSSGASLLLYGLTATEGKSTSSSPFAGGAIRNDGGFVTVLNSALTANSAMNYGGGIYNSGNGSAALIESTLSSNTAATSGGAIFSDSGSLTVVNSTISSNSTSYSSGSNGGAILTTVGATILNSTFFGNYVPPSNGWGGAIYDGGGVKIVNSTFANNSGWYGGGIYSDGHATTILNNIFYNNTASVAGGGIYNGSAFVADGFNLFYGNAGGDANVTLASNDLTGATSDPKLAVLGWYGGPTQTMVPLTGSAALNAGQYQSDAPITDQRGAARPSTNGATIDIGSVQLSGNPPMITSLSPISGSTSGEKTVTITGVGMDAASGVHFGGVAATSFSIGAATSTTPSYLTAISPANIAGAVDVTVVNPSGTSLASSNDQFTYVAPPAITSISPGYGRTSGGTSVTITGTHFSGATAVNFGASAAISYTVDSDTQITAFSPAQPGGLLYITVTDFYGTSSTGATSQFTYIPPPSVTSLSSSFGATTGGNIVVITGTNFLGATAVKFGSIDATTFTVNSDTQITATSPAQPAGGVDITVTTAYGASSTNTNDRFNYYEPVATTIMASNGTPQASPVTSSFATKLKVTVRDNFGAPMGGVTVTFSSPGSGASATFPASGCVTATSGAALGSCSVTATANATAGTYSVTASASGISTAAPFSLTNTSMPTFTVTTLEDNVSGVAANCNDTSDGSTPFPNCSLRDAIAAVSAIAQSTASTVTVDLMPTINFSSSLLTPGRLVPYPLGSGGTLEINENVNIAGPGAEKLAIDGSGAYPIFYAHQPSTATVNVSISGLTMGNGMGNTSYGAAITSKTGVLLTVRDSEFLNNSESAIYNENGEVQIINDLFTRNSGHGGGAIRNAGNLTVTNSTFSGNASVSLGGGAILSAPGSSLKILNSTISGNFATSGGGIWASPGATMYIANSIVSGNWVGTMTSISSYDDLIDSTGETTFAGSTHDLGGNVISFYNTESATAASPAITLAPLGYYGGAMQTMIPMPGSSAICVGLVSNLPSELRRTSVAQG